MSLCVKNLMKGLWTSLLDTHPNSRCSRMNPFPSLRFNLGGFPPKKSGAHGVLRIRNYVRPSSRRALPYEELVLAEEAPEVPTENRADGSPGAGQALDQPKKQEIEEDIQEQVPKPVFVNCAGFGFQTLDPRKRFCLKWVKVEGQLASTHSYLPVCQTPALIPFQTSKREIRKPLQGSQSKPYPHGRPSVYVYTDIHIYIYI